VQSGLICVTATGTQSGLFVLAAMVLTAAICDDAVAKNGKRRLHAHPPVESHRIESHGMESFGGASAKNEQAHLGPMRYYGGPKSPMWRGPAEN